MPPTFIMLENIKWTNCILTYTHKQIILCKWPKYFSLAWVINILLQSCCFNNKVDYYNLSGKRLLIHGSRVMLPATRISMELYLNNSKRILPSLAGNKPTMQPLLFAKCRKWPWTAAAPVATRTPSPNNSCLALSFPDNNIYVCLKRYLILITFTSQTLV